MAQFISKEEALKEIEERMEAIQLMTSDEQGICSKCNSLTTQKSRYGSGWEHCWCDYESPNYYEKY